MKDDDFWVSIEPVEDRYGGGYRTGHVILKRRDSSLSFSAYSCRLLDKVAPNRDYVQEGLCSFVGEESWKFIDAFAIGLKVDGALRKLVPGAVRACPWECEFTYGDGERTLHVSYFLLNAAHGCSGTIGARLVDPVSGAAIVFEPFFDIRPADGESEGMEAGITDGALVVSSGDKTACVRLKGGELRESGQAVEWKYKLGLGKRTGEGERIKPVPESRNIRSFYELEAPGNKAELRFSCCGSRKGAIELLGLRPGGPEEDRMLAGAMRSAIFPEYGGSGYEKAVVWRALGMARFGMGIEGVTCIDSGGLLSRKLLFMDQFEGLLQNYQTIKKVRGMDCFKNILLKAYEKQDEWGRMPAHAGADATSIAFILAGMAVRDTNDGDLARSSAEAFSKYLAGITACELMPDGPPMVKPNGLISACPALPWGDWYRDVEGVMVPERLSPAWALELIGRGATGELWMQKYLLPEVNARWIRCLEAGWLFSKYIRDFRLADRCKMIYYRALGSFKNVFYDKETGFLDNVVAADESSLGRRHDPTISSAGMTAAAILGTDAFTARELNGMAQAVKARLLRKKWGLPFGTAVIDRAECVYLDDEKEHGGTVCPGDTPYLVRLLRMTGDQEAADQVLESNLRHQMEEGFLFYNNELFSCDHDMVPVKDPVRWWSQWVDPYLEGRQ